MKKLFAAVFAAVLCLNVVQAADEPLWTPGTVLTLGGAGSTSIGDNTTAVGVNIGLSYEGLFNIPLELGVRQGFNYSGGGDAESVFGGSTEVGLDLNFYATQRLAVFGGVATGVRYADGVDFDWYGGPEAGVKFYLFEDVFLLGRVNYDIDINQRSGNDKDAWRYFIGIGVKF